MFRTVFTALSAASAGLPVRGPNTTLTNIPANPPAFGFTVVNAFGSLTFTNPVAIPLRQGHPPPRSVVEHGVLPAVLPHSPAPTRPPFPAVPGITSGCVPSAERGLLGLSFHPGYATNRFFFIYYPTTGALQDRLSRYQVSTGNSNAADAASETILFSHADYSPNHNAGDLYFGPDGYLYVSLGDEGNGDDSLANSHSIDKDLFSAILRIDVDKQPGSLEPNRHAAVATNVLGQAYYAVPPDNPFIGATSFNGSPVDPAAVHTEMWAVGMRNPWRMSFDPPTGRL